MGFIVENQSNTLIAFFNLMTILGPAIITAVISYLISHKQFEIKLKELRFSAQIRARELMYNNFQKKMSQLMENWKRYSESFSNFYNILILNGTEEEKSKYLTRFARILQFYRQDYYDMNIDYNSELLKLGLLNKENLNKVKIIEEFFNQEFDSAVSFKSLEDLLRQAIRVNNIMTSFESQIIEYRANLLFAEYAKGKMI